MMCIIRGLLIFMLSFVGLAYILLSLLGDSAEVSNNNIGDSNCLSTETPCINGCCPFSNGTCCVETQTCCQKGAVCLGPLATCIGLISDDKTGKSLYSEQAVRLRDITDCPDGYTPCYGGCCPVSSAVCCRDRQTCCPTGYNCGPGYCWKSGDGTKKSLNEVRPEPFYAQKSVSIGLNSDDKGRKSLHSEQVIHMRYITKCPKGCTPCYGGCCLSPDAVCCRDRRTCCLKGYHCFHDYCFKSSNDRNNYLNKIRPEYFSAQKLLFRVRPYSV